MVLALNHALMVLSWFENLPRDEQPPRHLWWSGSLLDDWFQDVRAKRGAGSGRKNSYQEADDVPMMANELADQVRPR